MRIITLILVISLLFTGCRFNTHDGMYWAGTFAYTIMRDPIILGAKSETNIFSKEDVSFTLYYGFFDLIEKEMNRKDFYLLEETDSVILVMYICEEEYIYDISNNQKYEDYTNIENHYFIKQLSENEAFSDEYGYSIDLKNGVSYSHSETINIPEQFFSEDSGSFVIKWVSFIEPSEGEAFYQSELVGYLRLHYDIMADGQVKITTLSKD